MNMLAGQGNLSESTNISNQYVAPIKNFAILFANVPQYSWTKEDLFLDI